MFRVHTNFDLDPFGTGLWAVTFEGRTVYRGTLFECAGWVAANR